MAQVVERTYPGIYLAENADAPRTITPATTALTAFIGPYERGPVNEAVLVTTWTEFSSIYGGIDGTSLAAYGVAQFFLNDGEGAWIVRVAPPDTKTASAKVWNLPLQAKEPGEAGNLLAVSFSTPEKDHIDVTVTLTTTFGSGPTVETETVVIETLPRLKAPDANSLAAAITSGSAYITAPPPTNVKLDPNGKPDAVALSGGDEGTWSATEFTTAVTNQLQDGGPLDRIAPQVFNILCVPDAAWLYGKAFPAIYTDAIEFCKKRQAFVLVDPPPPIAATPPQWLSTATTFPSALPSTNSTIAALKGFAESQGAKNGPFAALYYPWLEVNDPLNASQQRLVPPSGTIAGIYAGTDAASGVWKAPAGVDAVLIGATGLADATINDEVSGELNVSGINCLRHFPTYGLVVWGARTLAGADLIDSTWKYVPVRRLADFIEQSLLQSLRWAVFELNGPPLWSTISLEVGAFMGSLYAAGAFGGDTASQAYQVACDATTTTPEDMLRGVVNVVVGFQPIEPAEFVVLTIQIPMAAASPTS